MSIHFLRARTIKNTKYILWQTGNYQYQIELRDAVSMKPFTHINIHKSYEEASEKFDELSSTTGGLV